MPNQFRALAAWICFSLVAIFAPIAQAGSGVSGTVCPDAGLFNELIGGVCWSAMFPIRLAGTTMFAGNSGVPNDADTSTACSCGGSAQNLQLPTVGVSLGFWQPAMLLEATSEPFCSPAIGGVNVGAGTSKFFSGSLGGNVGSGPSVSSKNSTFYNVHLYTFPLLTMMQLLNVPSCNSGYNGMNMIGLSETEPQWNDDMLALLLSPEALMFANPMGVLSASGECASEIAGGQAIDSMYWSAGCWGLLYPFAGSSTYGADPIQASNLTVTRFLATQFRLGFLYQTTGSQVMCGPRHTAIIPKQQFRFQLMFPGNETTSVPNAGVPAGAPQSTGGASVITAPTQSGQCTHALGDTPLKWGEWDARPGSGGNYVYLVWQWTNCCLGLLGGQIGVNPGG